MVDPNTRQGKRAPVTLKIKFKSATLEQFIERYAVDVSHGGIFIRTKEPLAVGTQMRFEFQLRDATPLITGEGTVVWTRENDPARPGVAPGMGVRFDRLNEGSQQILDKILAEKAKGAGAHAPSDTKPPIFNEAPTKVAPSPLVGALKDESKPKIGQMAPPRAGFGDERTDATPLPKPMPFHSDADEFPEEAFEEATKVRSLDDLVAATKEPPPQAVVKPVPKPATTPPPVATAPPPAAAPPAAPAAAEDDKVTTKAPAIVSASLKDELAERRAAKAPDADEPVPAREPLEPAVEAPKPALPSLKDVAVAKAESRELKAEKRADRTPTPAKSKAEPVKPKPAAAVAPPRATSAEPAPRGAPIGLLLLLLVVVAGGAAFWFFYLRDRGDHEAGGGSAIASGSDVAGSGSASASGSDVASGSSGSAAASGSGSASAGSGSAVATADLLDVSITSSTKDATIDIPDAGVSGAALPYTGKLAKGKTLKAHVSAPGHLAQDVEVAAGKSVDVKLKSMPHVVHVTSKPGGAMIFVDGQPTRRTTPGDVDLTVAQADKGAKIELRKAGYDRFVGSIKSDAFSEDTDKLVASLDATLVAAKVVPNNNGGGNNTVVHHPGSGSATGGSGSATGSAGSGSATGSAAGSAGSGSGAGSASASTGSGSASGATTTTGSGAASGSAKAGSGSATTGAGSGSGTVKSGSGSAAGSAAGSGAATGSGSGSGSTEPTPDWMK